MATNGGKGFAGLGELVSDVAKEVDAASTPDVRPAPQPTPTPPPLQPQPVQAPPPLQVQPVQPAPSPQPSSTGQPQKTGGFGWVWAVFIGFIVIIVLSSNSGTSNNNVPVASSPPNSVAAPTQTVPAWQEEMPPVGTGRTFSSGEIRYCKSESVRIDAMLLALNEKSSEEIRRFNQTVGDYNGRCADYRYRKGSLETVIAEVERNRGKLANEGKNRVLSWRSETNPRTVVQPASQNYSSPTAAEVKAAKARARCLERHQQAIDACHRSMPDGAVSIGSLGACSADADKMYRCY